MVEFIDKELHSIAKKEADKIYKKNSAYKSGFIVKKYEELGGRFKGDYINKGLDRWFKEKWKDVGGLKYPVYRPTIRITKETPLTVKEIDKKDLKKKINEKQIIKGDKNLKPFKKKS
jgi:hypothetical protein